MLGSAIPMHYQIMTDRWRAILQHAYAWHYVAKSSIWNYCTRELANC